jgi:hypothetical protein
MADDSPQCLMQQQQLTISATLLACTDSHAIAARSSPMPNLQCIFNDHSSTRGRRRSASSACLKLPQCMMLIVQQPKL